MFCPPPYPQHLTHTLTWYICSTTDDLLNEVSLRFCDCVILLLILSDLFFLILISFFVLFVQLFTHFCLNCLLHLHSLLNQTVVLVHL